MSVPRLDTRMIDGKRTLLLGPFATFSTKFRKRGPLLDRPAPLGRDNFVPMMKASMGNLPLSRSAAQPLSRLMLGQEDRLAAPLGASPDASRPSSAHGKRTCFGCWFSILRYAIIRACLLPATPEAEFAGRPAFA